MMQNKTPLSHSETMKAGTEPIDSFRDIDKINAVKLEYGSIAWQVKACKWIYNTYKVSDKIIRLLSYLSAYDVAHGLNGKGVSISNFLKWQGWNHKAQRYTEWLIREGLKYEVIEKRPGLRNGFVLFMTPKGKQVIKAWHERIELYKANAMIKNQSKLK